MTLRLHCESDGTHRACVTIWLSSIAANAGASQPLELITSTMACAAVLVRAQTHYPTQKHNIAFKMYVEEYLLQAITTFDAC